MHASSKGSENTHGQVRCIIYMTKAALVIFKIHENNFDYKFQTSFFESEKQYYIKEVHKFKEHVTKQLQDSNLEILQLQSKLEAKWAETCVWNFFCL